MIIGVDATGLCGGGVMHFIEFFSILDPGKFVMERVVVWGKAVDLDMLFDNDWFTKIDVGVPDYPKGVLLWEGFSPSAKQVLERECDYKIFSYQRKKV